MPSPIAKMPFPNLNFHPYSGLSFPWAEYQGNNVMGSGDARMGSEGCTAVMVILVYWQDLANAVQQILGFSYRDAGGGSSSGNSLSTVPSLPISIADPNSLTTGSPPLSDGNTLRTVPGLPTSVESALAPPAAAAVGPGDGGGGSLGFSSSRLRRFLPWRHPYWNQLYAKNIVSIKGYHSTGPAVGVFPAQLVAVPNLPATAGRGAVANVGWRTDFFIAQLTIEFWRPPYAVRTDNDIVADGNAQEWLRYVDRNWEFNGQMLSREGMQFVFGSATTPDAGGPPGKAKQPSPGSPGVPVSRLRVKRRWYEVPEACLFGIAADSMTPTGLPYNILYMQTPTTNPITGFSIDVSNNPNDTSGFRTWPLPGTVNSPIGGGTDDSDDTLRFMGCYMGTFLFEGVEFIPRPLQLPAALMAIGVFNGNEPISQVQFDVVIHGTIFDPPRNPKVNPFRGWNLQPYTGNGLWYPVQCQKDILGNPLLTAPLTPFHYADHTDIFKVL